MQKPSRVLWLLALLTLALALAACNSNKTTPTPAPFNRIPTPAPLPTRGVRASPTAIVEETTTLTAPTATPTVAPSPSPTPTPNTRMRSFLLPGAYVEKSRALLLDAPGGHTLANLPAGARVGLLARSANNAWFQALYQPDPEHPGLTGWIRARDVVIFADLDSIPVSGRAELAAATEAPVPVTTETVTTPTSQENVRGQATVTASRLRLRAGPGIDQRIKGVLPRGEQVGLVGRTADGVWLQVITAGGDRGWVATRWLQSEVDLQKLPVTGASTTAAPTPAPSSARGKIVFQTHNDGDIYIIGADGRGLQRLTRGFDPALSPDGGQVAFTRWDEPRGLWIIDSDGRNERLLFTANRPRSPTWTADGAAIVFERNVSSRSCRNTPLGCLTESEWSAAVGSDCMDTPLGRYCFTDFPQVDQQIAGLTRYDLATGEARDLPATVDARAPRLDSNSDRIVYLDREGLAQTYSNGSASPTRLVASSGLGPAVFSPDGQFIYTSQQSGDHWDIWRYRADGSQPKALTAPPPLRSAPVNSVAPVVSPGGRTLLFLTDRRGKWELWLMNRDGSKPRPFAPATLADISFRYDFANERMADWR